MTISAREQFENDYILVTDNDRNLYHRMLETAREYCPNDVGDFAEALEKEWGEFIEGVLERERNAGTEGGALILSQLLNGWGSDVWYDIAKYYSEVIQEERMMFCEEAEKNALRA